MHDLPVDPDKPAMSDEEEGDIIALDKTLFQTRRNQMHEAAE